MIPNSTGLIRVGLVGYGFAGKTFHAPLVQAVDGLSLIAVASSDAVKVHASLPAVTVRDNLESMIADDDIDLVIVATPNETHAPLSRMALEAGKHVVVDKPFALDLNEARDLLHLADQVNRNLWVFHNRRWDSDYLTVKAALEEGIVGRVVHFESKIDRFRPAVRDRWRERAQRGGGIWFDLGPHLIDQVLQIFGLPDSVNASLASQRDGALIDDWAHVILTYGERRVVLQGAMLVAGGSARFVVHGSGGSLVKLKADQQEPQLLTGMRPGEHGWGSDPDALAVYGPDGERSIPATPGDQRRFYELVAEALRGNRAGPVRPIEALAVMAVIEAGMISASNGVTVPLSLTDDECAAWG
ncbi:MULTISPECIES: oxidoreductase [Acidiphilium]|uniref:Predicted dehydrogenase n=1 Tax=Acidiphilium rubrum TaxID=526 RepID=A0A8G2CNG2_ACIRU|nr:MULTISPECIES: oxidoreductase [Acidiphilium]SIR43413.1 Predicted dehydrogenase [Acidiphilium rubrum]